MQKMPKQEYTAAFKEQAVNRAKEGKSVAAVAKEMGLVEQTLRHWMKAFDAGTLKGAAAPKVAAEAMDLSRLRAENVRLRHKVDILLTARTVEVAIQRLLARGDPRRSPRSADCRRRPSPPP